MEQNGLGSLSGQAECILCGYGKGYPDALTGTLEFSWEVRGLYGKQDTNCPIQHPKAQKVPRPILEKSSTERHFSTRICP